MLEKALVRRSDTTPPRAFSALPPSRRPPRARDGHYSDSLLARAAAALGLTVLLAAGCSSSAQLNFRCDAPINGGLLLTVDVVRASEEQARLIQSLGERWFYDGSRETLRSSGAINTVTFPTNDPSGQCVRDVSVPVTGKDKFLVIVADYKFQSPDTSKQVVTLSRDRFKGKTLRIAVHDRELSVESR